MDESSQNPLGQRENNEPREHQCGQFEMGRHARSAPSAAVAGARFHSGLSQLHPRFAAVREFDASGFEGVPDRRDGQRGHFALPALNCCDRCLADARFAG